MARLVKVEDAARMAGISSATLVRELNAALGIESERADAGQAVGAVPAAAPAGVGSPAPQHPPHAPVVEVDVREDLRMGREPFSKIIAAVGELGADEVLRLRATFEPVPLFALLAKRGLVHEARAEGPDDWSVWFWRPRDLDVSPEPLSTPTHPVLNAAGAEGPGPATVVLDVRGLEPPEPMVKTLAALEDVRAIPPRDKHPAIFRTFDALASGQAMVLVNDHDPRPLRYQLSAERPDSFDWAYEAERPEAWRVRISRR